MSDGHNLSSGNKLGSVGFVGGNTDRAYRTVYTVSFDDEVVAGSCLTHDGEVRHEPTAAALADRKGAN